MINELLVADKYLEDLPLVKKSSLFRVLQVSPTFGNPIVQELRDAGLICPVVSPSNRLEFSPKDARVIVERVRNG